MENLVFKKQIKQLQSRIKNSGQKQVPQVDPSSAVCAQELQYKNERLVKEVQNISEKYQELQSKNDLLVLNN